MYCVVGRVASGVCGVLFFFFRGRHGHKQDRRKHRVYIKFWCGMFHSGGRSLQISLIRHLPSPAEFTREDAHCVFAASNWTERNAAMTQEQHFDQGEMVDGRAATLGRRKITVRCRDTMVQISNIVFFNRFIVSLACSFWDPLTYHMLTERCYGVGEN